jgi:outer membrane protein assembly factor BamB
MLACQPKIAVLAKCLSIGALVVCSAQCNGQEDYRTFRNGTGRTIEARVIDVRGEQVTIQRRSDGRRFTVAVAIFSAADQAYLRGWTRPDSPATSDPSPSAAGLDWPRFRGPSGMGTSAATGLPVEWNQTRNVVWKTQLPGPGASSPIVYGDRVYVTCYTGYFVPDQPGGSLEQLRRHLVAVQLEDGRILWDESEPARLPEEERIRDHGYAANSVVADAERVYTFFGKSGVFAYDHQGGRVWQADVGSKTNGWGTAASPILHKDLLIVNASIESEALVALNRRTGQEQWRAGGIRESWNTPLVVTAPSGRQELVVATHGSVLAFEPDTGQPLWSCKTDIGWYMVPSVIAADGIVYCLGGRSGTASLAVRAGGSGDVTATHRLWTSQKGSNVSSPVYLDGRLYWSHESREIAYAADAATGDVIYEQRLSRAGQFYASALLADGRLYYTNRGGKTFVVAAQPQFELLAVNELSDGSTFNASPAVAGNRLLLRSDKYLYCIGQ